MGRARVKLLLLTTSFVLLAGAAASAQERAGDAIGTLIPPGFPNVVAFATNSIHLQQGSLVISGDVIVNDASPGPVLDSGAELSVGKDVVTLETSTLKADSIRVKATGVVWGDVYCNELTNNGFIGGTRHTPLALPVFAAPPPFKSGTPGTQDVVVRAGLTVTLPPGSYRLLDVRLGGVVYFTGGVYDFSEIKTGPEVALFFDAPSDVQVAGKFAAGADAWIAPSPGAPVPASDVVFFVAGVNGASGGLGATPKAAQIGPRSIVRANFYAPNGTLLIRQDTSATGAFLARDVDLGPKAALVLESAFYNRAPVAVNDSASGTRGGTITWLASGASSVLANDSDPNGDALAVTTTPVSGPFHGTLALQADGTFAYTHDGSQSAGDIFTYEVCDPGFPVLCDTATVTFTLDIPPYTVSVQKAGTGSGSVTSSPAGIDCGATCSAPFASFLDVVLQAAPDPGSIFTGFGGDADCADGIVSGPVDVACIATFEAFSGVTLTVQKNGTGGGYVSSTPAGIDCGPRCSADYPRFARVELSAVADAGSVFAGFGGDPGCENGQVALDVAKTCTATFELLPPPPPRSRLTVVPVGSGTGTVTSNPPGIVCGGLCEALFADGSTVTLFARPDDEAVFVGWGGDCAGESFSTSVTIGPDKTCTATFATP